MPQYGFLGFDGGSLGYFDVKVIEVYDLIPLEGDLARILAICEGAGRTWRAFW